MNVRSVVFALSFSACLWMWFSVLAQEAARPVVLSSEESTPKNVTPEELRKEQLAISGRYARFERMLTQMADVLGRQDPERADLLRRAIGKGLGRDKDEHFLLVGNLCSGPEQRANTR